MIHRLRAKQRLLTALTGAAGVIVLLVFFFVVTFGLEDKKAEQPQDACREASVVLYAHIGGMFDQITQEALIGGGFTGLYEIYSDGEVFPRVWYDFVTACVPPPPPETGTS